MLEPFGQGAVVVREVPAMLGEVEVKGLVRDLADEIAEFGAALGLKERLEEVCGTLACHGSVRAGRRLTSPRWMPCCARWRPRPIPASATTAARPMSS